MACWLELGVFRRVDVSPFQGKRTWKLSSNADRDPSTRDGPLDPPPTPYCLRTSRSGKQDVSPDTKVRMKTQTLTSFQYV
jgi:hypothetical protein